MFRFATSLEDYDCEVTHDLYMLLDDDRIQLFFTTKTSSFNREEMEMQEVIFQ